MSDPLHIHNIILQLIRVSELDYTDRVEHIRNLTPVNHVFIMPNKPVPENTLFVGKETPFENKTNLDDLHTQITSEELYGYYSDPSEEDFILRLNKTLYDHIQERKSVAEESDSWNSFNLWYMPNTKFFNWFEMKGIDHADIESFTFNDDNHEKRDWTLTLAEIADECRHRTEIYLFKTYREAYRYAEKNWTQNGKPLNAARLEKAYWKAKSEGKID